MDNNEDDGKSIQPRSNVESGCINVLQIGAFILVVMVVCGISASLYRQLNHHFSVNQYREQWETLGLVNYLLTIHRYGPGFSQTYTITIQNGIADCTDCEDGMFDVATPMDTVFELASRCTSLFCSVHYDADYGYPTRIGGGFIEGSWMQIVVQPENEGE